MFDRIARYQSWKLLRKQNFHFCYFNKTSLFLRRWCFDRAENQFHISRDLGSISFRLLFECEKKAPSTLDIEDFFTCQWKVCFKCKRFDDFTWQKNFMREKFITMGRFSFLPLFSECKRIVRNGKIKKKWKDCLHKIRLQRVYCNWIGVSHYTFANQFARCWTIYCRAIVLQINHITVHENELWKGIDEKAIRNLWIKKNHGI